MRALSAVTFALLVGGCAAAGGGFAVAATPAPDLRGTWTGTWADTPVTLVIAEQADVGREGLYAGSWMVFGRVAPGLTGVLTSVIRGQAVMTTAEGVIALTADGVILTLSAPTTFGDQWLTLRSEGPDSFVGAGEASFGPHGTVFLTRVP